jgi:3-oxoadipate enol-lactonase
VQRVNSTTHWHNHLRLNYRSLSLRNIMPYCESNAIQLYYQLAGDGPNLLLVSGLGGGTWSWFGQVPYFARHYRVIAVDNRGAGRSGMPPGPYRIDQFAADLLGLLDHLQIARTFVLGLSMGGMIAQELALLAGDRIDALVLGCTHCGGSQRISPNPEILARFVNNEGLSIEQIVDKNLPFFLSSHFMKAHPERVELYRQAQLTAPLQPPHAFHGQVDAIRTFDCCDRLGRLTIPTRVLTGTADMLVPPANATALARFIPGARLTEIPGAGHALHVECRDDLNGLAHGFFNTVLHD